MWKSLSVRSYSWNVSMFWFFDVHFRCHPYFWLALSRVHVFMWWASVYVCVCELDAGCWHNRKYISALINQPKLITTRFSIKSLNYANEWTFPTSASVFLLSRSHWFFFFRFFLLLLSACLMLRSFFRQTHSLYVVLWVYSMGHHWLSWLIK